jgi:hypothetical protein
VPGTRLEQLIFLIGVAAAAGLAILTFTAWRDYRDSAPAPAAAPPPPPTTSAVAAAELKSRSHPRATLSRLVLTAARGDSWVEVRAGSATGKSLYANTLTQGRHLIYRRVQLWIRFGLPVNIDATIDGKPAALPAGVASVLLRNGRLQTVQTG